MVDVVGGRGGAPRSENGKVSEEGREVGSWEAGSWVEAPNELAGFPLDFAGCVGAEAGMRLMACARTVSSPNLLGPRVAEREGG